MWVKLLNLKYFIHFSIVFANKLYVENNIDPLLRTHKKSIAESFREVKRRHLPDSPCWSASWARRTPWCCRVVASLDHAQIVSDCNRNGNEKCQTRLKSKLEGKWLATRANASGKIGRKEPEFMLAPAAGRSPTGWFSMLYRSICTYTHRRVYFPASKWLVSRRWCNTRWRRIAFRARLSQIPVTPRVYNTVISHAWSRNRADPTS